MDDYRTWIVSMDDDGILQARTVYGFSDDLVDYGIWHVEDGCHDGESLEYRRIKEVWSSEAGPRCLSLMSFMGGYTLGCELPPHQSGKHESFSDKHSREWG